MFAHYKFAHFHCWMPSMAWAYRSGYIPWTWWRSGLFPFSSNWLMLPRAFCMCLWVHTCVCFCTPGCVCSFSRWCQTTFQSGGTKHPPTPHHERGQCPALSLAPVKPFHFSQDVLGGEGWFLAFVCVSLWLTDSCAYWPFGYPLLPIFLLICQCFLHDLWELSVYSG